MLMEKLSMKHTHAPSSYCCGGQPRWKSSLDTWTKLIDRNDGDLSIYLLPLYLPLNAPDGSDPKLLVVPSPCRPADSPHMHCPILAAAPAMTSAIPSYAPGLRGGAGHRVGAAVEEGVGAGRVGRGQAEPALGGELPLPWEVQLAADLVQHLDTVQHITVQYSTVQVQYRR